MTYNGQCKHIFLTDLKTNIMEEIKKELKEQFESNLMFDEDNEPNRYMFNEKQLDIFIDEVVKKLGLHIVSISEAQF